MRHTILCARSGCNVRFRPKGNQQYCSSACRAEERRVQNRRAQRRHRLKEFFARCEKLLRGQQAGKVSADRREPTRFTYRCDHCHCRVLRRARQLFVFCCNSCHLAFRRSRRRLVRRFLRWFKNRCDPYLRLVPSRGPQIFSSPNTDKILLL